MLEVGDTVIANASASHVLSQFSRHATAVIAIGLALSAQSAICQPVSLPPAPAGVPTFVAQGLEFSVVNTAGVLPPTLPPQGGRSFLVDIPSFAISRTELAVSQWYELHNAFVETPLPAGAQYNSWLGDQLRSAGGIGAVVVGQSAIGRPIFAMEDVAYNLSLRSATWLQAAMYCNWLHNDRVVSIESIMTGAYDLRGAVVGNPASFGAIRRSPNARFWLPSDSEWSIASFWDPNHPDSTGGGAWWTYLNRRNRVGIGGLPPPEGDGETSYGAGGIGNLIPIGAFINSQSAFGLLDTSGGAREWLDTSGAIEGTTLYDADRLVAGTEIVAPGTLFDELERIGGLNASFSTGGIRIAGLIPAPGTLVVWLFVFSYSNARRRSR